MGRGCIWEMEKREKLRYVHFHFHLSERIRVLIFHIISLSHNIHKILQRPPLVTWYFSHNVHNIFGRSLLAIVVTTVVICLQCWERRLRHFNRSLRAVYCGSAGQKIMPKKEEKRSFSKLSTQLTKTLVCKKLWYSQLGPRIVRRCEYKRQIFYFPNLFYLLPYCHF